jgi:hypothetical protein
MDTNKAWPIKKADNTDLNTGEGNLTHGNRIKRAVSGAEHQFPRSI